MYDNNNEAYPYLLTEMPAVSDDGLVVTMTLRDDLVLVRWNNTYCG